MPRALYQYRLELERVLDLAAREARRQVGVSLEDLVGAEWTLCQSLGAAARDHGDQAIRAPSATGVDHVLIVFPEHLEGGLADVALVERWEEVSDL